MDIYWIIGKKQCGPATVPDVISLVQMEELTPDSLGWHAGCEHWMPLRELPALADFLQERPAQESQDDLPPVPGEGEPAVETPAKAPDLPHGAVRVYLPSPGVRLLARLVDMALYVTLLFGVIYVREIPFNASLLPSSPLAWIAFVLLEACLLRALGTTPGKALLGIHVRSVDGSELGFGRAFARSCLVFLGGVGMMVSLLPLFMMGYSWWVLRTRGITMWDARCTTLPLQMAPTRLARQLIALAVVFGCVQLTSYCMQPWFLPMIETVEQQSPEAGQWMRQLLPPEQK